MNDKYITILTPVYNRKECMKKLYQSLLDQTDLSFEWLIVDDGSTDNLEEYICTIISNATFDIQYVRKENGGKHTAINYGMNYIDSKLTFIVDSDDWLEADAVETIKTLWKEYGDNENVGGIQLQTQLLNDKEKMRFFEKEGCYFYKEMKARGVECAMAYRTDILKRYPFPVFENEHFCSEGCVFIPINDNYKMIFSNRIVRISEYRDDGLTAGGLSLLLKNPKGMMVNTLAIYNSDSFNYAKRLKNMISYVSYGLFAHLHVKMIIVESRSAVMASICYPFGYLLYKKRKKYLN